MTGVVKGTIFAVGVGLIASLAIFTAIDYQVMHGGDGATKSHDEVTYSQFQSANFTGYKSDIAVDLEATTHLVDNPGDEISVYIGPDQAQNVTIWNGGKMICYIPRGDITEYSVLTGLGNGTSHN